jgi:hypothetical protein
MSPAREKFPLPERISRRQARLPVDYQALAPELICLDLRQQRACLRVSFSQLRAVVAPGASGQTAMASATSLSSLAGSFGGAMSQRVNSVSGLSWLSWAGKYDLVFTRPPGARTDARAAISNRICCGDAAADVTILPLTGMALPYEPGEVASCRIGDRIQRLPATYRDAVLAEARRVSDQVAVGFAAPQAAGNIVLDEP